MFTQRHYKAIADVFASVDPDGLTAVAYEYRLAEALAAMFEQDSDRFKPDVFRAACQLVVDEPKRDAIREQLGIAQTNDKNEGSR